MLCTFVCVQIGRTIHCRILRVNLEKFSVDLTCRSSDLADRDNRFRFVQPCLLMCVHVRMCVRVRVSVCVRVFLRFSICVHVFNSLSLFYGLVLLGMYRACITHFVPKLNFKCHPYLMLIISMLLKRFQFVAFHFIISLPRDTYYDHGQEEHDSRADRSTKQKPKNRKLKL